LQESYEKVVISLENVDSDETIVYSAGKEDLPKETAIRTVFLNS
jgi:hypothetical protein